MFLNPSGSYIKSCRSWKNVLRFAEKIQEYLSSLGKHVSLLAV